MLYDGGRLYLLELKSHKGSSLPFTAIRKNQLTELSKASTYKNITAGFIINFAEKERTFFCKVDDVLYFIEHEDRKSIPISWCEEWGREIQSRKLKANYRYDLERWLSNAD
jgi:recombination protein U